MHAGSNTMNITDKKRGQNIQFLILPSTKEHPFTVTVDEYLPWKEHLDKECTKVSRSAGVISKLRYFLPQYTLVTLYNAIVMSHLMYCNIAWGHTFRTHVHKLQVLQKKVFRYITNSEYSSPSTPFLLQLHILPFDELVSLNCLIFMFKCQSLQHTFLTNVFVENSSIHHYHTRQSNLVHQSYARTHTALKSFRTVCVKKWNKLPLNIISSTTLARFKISCKKHLFNRLLSDTWMYKTRWGSHVWSVRYVCVCVCVRICVCVCVVIGGGGILICIICYVVSLLHTHELYSL